MAIHNNTWTDEIKNLILELAKQKKSLTLMCVKTKIPKQNLVYYLRQNKIEHPEIRYRKK